MNASNVNTRQRQYHGGTQFTNWIRRVPELDSKEFGYTASDVDLVWSNFKTGQFMLIEEKRKMDKLYPGQISIFKNLHESIRNPKYSGFHFIQFENSSPLDGKIFVNGLELLDNEFIQFFTFRKLRFTSLFDVPDWYVKFVHSSNEIKNMNDKFNQQAKLF